MMHAIRPVVANGRRFARLVECQHQPIFRLAVIGNDDGELDQYAWFEVDSERRAHSVGEKKPNRFGLYDMHGNVAEWVEDCYHEHYRDADPNGAAWTAANCNRRVIRGGSWLVTEANCRSAARFWQTPDEVKDFVGFRVARNP